MSDLTEALESYDRVMAKVEAKHPGATDVIGVAPVILEAARKYAALTSPETIGKAAEVLMAYVDVDPAIEPNEWHLAARHNARVAAKFVLRAVTEDTQ